MNYKGSRQAVKKLALDAIRLIQSIESESADKISSLAHKTPPTDKNVDNHLNLLIGVLSARKMTGSLYWSRYVKGSAE